MARFLVVVAAFLLGGCQLSSAAQDESAVVTGDALILYPGLRKAIEEYYLAEARRDWQKTYARRPAAFQRMVPFDVYQREMDKGSSGWNLVRVDVQKSMRSDKNDEVIVVLEFQESFNAAVAQSRFEGRVSSGTTSRTEESIWKRSETSWISVQPGQRGHLPLNDRVVH